MLICKNEIMQYLPWDY